MPRSLCSLGMSLVILLALIVPLTVTAQDPGISTSATVEGQRPIAPSPLGPEAVLWDQYNNWSHTDFAAQDFESSYDAYDIWVGDDFENAEPWTIGRIVARGGWRYYVDLINATAINWTICADAGGAPGCVPGDGSEFWTLSLPPRGPQVTLSMFEAADFVVDLDTPIDLPAGTWWIIFQVALEYTYYGQYGISGTADPAWGTPAMWINPNGGFGMGSDWFINDFGYDLMFRLEEPAEPMYARIKMDGRPYDYGYSAVGFVQVKDEAGDPLAGAEVTVFLMDPDGNTWTETRFSNDSGRAKFLMTHPAGGQWLMCIDSIFLGGYDWNPADSFPKCASVYYP